jgi:hypothetical protein
MSITRAHPAAIVIPIAVEPDTVGAMTGVPVARRVDHVFEIPSRWDPTDISCVVGGIQVQKAATASQSKSRSLKTLAALDRYHCLH